eukprot:TRINITY_DN7174_c0_g1_i2.p1 TRINITY_DN7174_c0_g1~~TRINITY_DN7174_c0_g1_i2.p1  ORF type:complete len:260 (+),score=46.79 TRINITY_DN7174_c0_g1_i2:385-1164(+)
MRFHSDSVLVIKFTETVKSKVSSRQLVQTIELRLEKGCKLSWSLLSDFYADAAFDELLFEIKPECNIKGKITCIAIFTNRMLISDLNGNELAEDIVKAGRSKYKYKQSEPIAEAVGAIINYTSSSVFIFMIVVSFAQGYAVGSLWHFVNMIQILSYLPLLDCEIPENYRVILTKYISIKDVAIPLDFLPDIPFSPAHYFTKFVTDPLNEKFSELDYESVSFIFNFADELNTWFLLGLAYVLLRLLVYFAPNFGYFAPQT